MPTAEIARVRAEIDTLYRKDSRRIFATLIRLLGDFERAEEAMHEAFRAAVEKWPSDGLPQNPVSWLISAGRFKSIDKQRRDARMEHLEDRPDVSEALADQGAAPDDLPELPRLQRLGVKSYPESREAWIEFATARYPKLVVEFSGPLAEPKIRCEMIGSAGDWVIGFSS